MGARSAISDYEVCYEYKQRMLKTQSGSFHFPWPYEVLKERFSVPEKVAYSACERAYDHGLIECGVSLRSGWLTEKGEKLLNENA